MLGDEFDPWDDDFYNRLKESLLRKSQESLAEEGNYDPSEDDFW